MSVRPIRGSCSRRTSALPTTDPACTAYNVPQHVPGTGPSAPGYTLDHYDDTGPATLADTTFLSPDHAVWFYGAAGAVLLLGVLGIWAASAGRREQAEG